jgi:hypothetical protein
MPSNFVADFWLPLWNGLLCKRPDLSSNVNKQVQHNTTILAEQDKHCSNARKILKDHDVVVSAPLEHYM